MIATSLRDLLENPTATGAPAGITDQFTTASPLAVFDRGYCIDKQLKLVFDQTDSLSGVDAIVLEEKSGAKLFQLAGGAFSSSYTATDLVTGKPAFTIANANFLGLSSTFKISNAAGELAVKAKVDGSAATVNATFYKADVGVDAVHVHYYEATKTIYFHAGADDKSPMIARGKREGSKPGNEAADTYSVEIAANGDIALIVVLTALVDQARESVRPVKPIKPIKF
ncbi:hypothetical protein H9P43_009289 [Blastocladiella emersonii ATCC 22665]|nr:hypothetical protein H9P43_009289 [Blastocladiella emersonii ATCC 22665]